MLVGYNTNIFYKEHVYHVQTEDSGQKNPVIVSLIYSQGAIIASRKTNYAHIAHDPDFREKVTKIMKTQHKWMMKELLAGKFTGDYQEAVEEVKAVEEVREAQETGEDTTSPQKGEEQPPPSSQSIEMRAKHQLSKSLDDILLNHIMKRDKK